MHLETERTIEALVPVYTEQGDCTHVFMADGRQRTFPMTVDAVLARLAKKHHRQLAAMRLAARGMLGYRDSPPLHFHSGLLLVALKMRKPRVKGDASRGYLNLAVYKTAVPDGGQTLVTMCSGRKFASLWSAKTTLAHLHDAHQLKLLTMQTEPFLRILDAFAGAFYFLADDNRWDGPRKDGTPFF